jgi:hypothetical protein
VTAPTMDRMTVNASRTTGSSKTNWGPFVVAFLIIALGGAGLAYFRAHQKLGAPGVKVVMVGLRDENGNVVTTRGVPLPEKVLEFRSELLPITTQLLQTLPGDTTYGRRLYSSDDGFGASASVVLMGADRTSIHKPEFCLPGGGWNIDKKEADTIRIDSPAPYDLPVMKWSVSQEVRGGVLHGFYIFWFVNDREITREHSGRMISIAKSMLSKGELERWAYISYLVFCQPGQEDAAYARAKKLIAASVPQYQLVNGANLARK